MYLRQQDSTILEKKTILQGYNEHEDSEEHIKHVDERLDYYQADGDIKWKLFVLWQNSFETGTNPSLTGA